MHFIIQYTLHYIVQYTLHYIIQYTLHMMTAQCTMYNVHYNHWKSLNIFNIDDINSGTWYELKML